MRMYAFRIVDERATHLCALSKAAGRAGGTPEGNPEEAAEGERQTWLWRVLAIQKSLSSRKRSSSALLAVSKRDVERQPRKRVERRR